MIIVWFMTHEWRISLYAGMFELIAKISLFYCHERFGFGLKTLKIAKSGFYPVSP